MEGDFIKINEWLRPLSWLYGLGVGFRNLLFEMGILKSRAFDVPVISVGNITVGGTGKTPHVEYLVRLLQNRFHVAVLSRGYKRKSRGFLIANEHTTALEIGDEPFQMKRKFPAATVAVDKKRVHGIEQLMDVNSQLDVVLLDDAFQHRYVKPGVNILLVDYHRLIIYDCLLPAGRLREPLSGKNRADIVIVTKCPKTLRPMDYRVITKAMNLYPYQQLFFTTLDYEALQPVFPNKNRQQRQRLEQIPSNTNVLLLTGIASPRQMKEDIMASSQCVLTELSFADHQNFRKKDIQLVNDTFAALPSPKCIITTEKDAARIITTEGWSDEVCAALFALPVKICFALEQEDTFNQLIMGYVHKNAKDSILTRSKRTADAPRPTSKVASPPVSCNDADDDDDTPRTISFR